MNAFLSILQSLFRRPYDALLSEDGMLGGFWNRSARGRSLLLGLPAIILGLSGISLLMATQFVSPQSLESKYEVRLSQSRERATELATELDRELKMQLTSAELTSLEKINEVLPLDDPRRIELEKTKKEQRIYLMKLSAINPDNDEYMFELAKLAIAERQADQLASGLAMIRKISPIDEPGYIPGHLFLARRHLAMYSADSPANRDRHLGTAVRHLENTLIREKDNEPALGLLGQIFFKMGRLEKAYPHLEKLFKADPTKYRALVDINNQLERPLDNKSILEDALRYLNSQISSTPVEDREVRDSLIRQAAECYILQKDYEGASSFLEKELERFNSNNVAADRIDLVNQLLCLVHLEWTSLFPSDTPESKRQRLEKLTEAYKFSQKNSDVKRYLTRLALGAEAEIAEKARSVYDARQDADPPPAVINELGIDALSHSRYQEALEMFTKAKNKLPRNPEILNNLAYTHLKSETPNPKLALALVQDAIRFTPTVASMSKYKTNFLDTRARAYMQLGQYSLAIADLTRAWQDRQDNLEIIQAIIDCYRADNMESDAAIWESKLEEQIRIKNQSGDSNGTGFAVPKAKLEGN